MHLTYLALDTERLEPFEIGALLDTVLCYPTWSADRQKAVAIAICSEIVASWIEARPELRAEYAHYRKSTARTSLQSLAKRRDHALRTGLAFLPHLKQAAIGRLPIFEGVERELSFSEVVRFLWPEGGHEDNYESRIHDLQRSLRNSSPTAHLAAAYQTIARERSGAEKAAEFNYEDIGLHREAVRRANVFANHFLAVPRLANNARRLMTLEWRE